MMSMYSVLSRSKAMVGIGPNLSGQEHFGYTEPFRRFVQRESFEPQANAIPNDAPSWLPGDDYYTNFHLGDPYVKVDQGFARLPGAGYEAIHPELQGVDPEDYPDMNKLAILADVAPYSREYNTFRQKVGAAVHGNTEAEIEYEKILNRVKQSRESIIRMVCAAPREVAVLDRGVDMDGRPERPADP